MLPMGQMELAPTEYAISMRPVFVLCLTLLLAIVVGKFVIHDVWGAVSLIFVLLMGVLVLSGPYKVNATSALFYSAMAIISGIFDMISCVLYFEHSKYRMMDQSAPRIVLLAQTMFLISPIALFLSAMVSYSIFADCRDHAQETMPMGGAGVDYTMLGGVYDWEGGYGPPQGLPPAQVQQALQPPRDPSIASQVPQPFQGVSRRLDGSTSLKTSTPEPIKA